MMDPNAMEPDDRLAAYRVEARMLAEKFGVTFRELAAVNPNEDGTWPSIPEFRLAMARLFHEHRQKNPEIGMTETYSFDIESHPEIPRTELEFLIRQAQAQGQHVVKLRPGRRPPKILRLHGPRRRPDAGKRRPTR